MKNKCYIILTIIGSLVLLIGLSYAYFMVNSSTVGNTGSANIKTVTIDDVGFNIEGLLEFKDLDIYPGHKNISKIKVTVFGNNDTINYKLVWEGINSINTPLKYYVYKTEENEEVNIICQKEIEQIGASKYYYETCNNNNLDNLGEIVNEGEITKTEEKKEFVLSENEVIKGTEEGSVIYYYVVLEYPNLEESQNIDMGGKFEGLVTVKKEEDASSDITIKKIYQQTENGYEEINRMPENGYELNREKSTCTNNAIPKLKNNNILITNLTTSGTECNIYFDKKTPTASEIILNNITVKTETPVFSNMAITDEGVYKINDGMYGGYSYYWRGAATNNYVKFANFCWRIIRINGDGSIRLIYDGSSCHANGTPTAESIAVASVKYNTAYNQSNYVGWTYEGTNQRTLSGTPSNAKTQLESWFNSNIGNNTTYASKIVDGKYCNDRDIASGYTWAIKPSRTIYYAAYKRIKTDYSPTMVCNLEDEYTLKVGLITADEVVYAGGNFENNTTYYLYNGQDYWTMSPSSWGSSGNAYVFRVDTSGNLGNNRGVGAPVGSGLRPVINLKADTLFAAGGNGTLENPYVVQ